MDEIRVEGVRFAEAREAVTHARMYGADAIRFAGRILVVEREEAVRLERENFAFAYLCEFKGRIVTVPANQGDADEA